MDSGRRHESRQLFQEFERREDDASGAVTPRSFEAIVDIAVVSLGKPLFGDSGASGVAHQLFEACFVGAPSRDSGMEGESHEGDCHVAGEFRLTLQVIFFELFDEATNVLALADSESDFVLSGGGLNTCKRIVRVGVVIGNDINATFVLLDEIHSPQDSQNAAGDFFYAAE